MTVIKCSAPTRVDLAGGTLDLWPLSMLVDDAVTVNCAISIRTGCELELGGETWRFEPRGLAPLELARLPRRPEREVAGKYQLAAVVAAHFDLPPCHVVTWSEAAPGSGLGGSSSLIVSLIAAAAHATGVPLSDEEAVSLACNLETRVLGLPAGNQDHWAAQCGGLSVLEYSPGGVRRAAVTGPAASVADALVVADTCVEHHSGMNNWSVFKGVLERDAEAAGALGAVSTAAVRMRDALLSGATGADLLARVREALKAEWSARRRLSAAVSSPEIERIVAAVEAAGGAAKVCGAGGGGCVVCVPASIDARPELAAIVSGTGARVLDVRAAAGGVRLD